MRVARVAAVIAAIALVGTVSCVIAVRWLIRSGIEAQFREIRKKEALMQSPPTYEEAGRQLALCCHFLEGQTRTDDWGTTWLPKAVRDLRPHDACVSRDGCTVEMGGGFYHYGYRLTRVERGDIDTQSRWELYYYNDETEKLLTTVTLGAGERLSPQEIAQLAVASFEAGVAPGSNKIGLYQKAFRLLMELSDREPARALCDDAIKACPEHWWPRLTAALMDSGGPTPEAASDRFKQWVDANPSLAHYAYLSYFYDAIGNKDAACRAAKCAGEQPLVDSSDSSDNRWSLAYAALSIAFKHGCYETVIELADRFLGAWGSGNCLCYDVFGMNAAAHFLLGERVRGAALVHDIQPPEVAPQWGWYLASAIETLQEAIERDDPDAIRAWANSRAAGLAPYHDLPMERIRGIAGATGPP